MLTLPTPDKDAYLSAKPFPYAVFKLEDLIIRDCAKEFPDLAKIADRKWDKDNQKKLVTFGESKLSLSAIQLVRYLNSEPFLLWLTELTGMEHLIPDPYLIGGGYHEIKKGGKLGIHVDFNKHGLWGADRVLNVLIYLNEGWIDAWGGHLKLYDEDLNEVVKVLPEIGTMAIFSTSERSWHGHPEPLECPEGRSRKSIALYYYSAPKVEWTSHDTIFRTK
jgi:Rps23 Pro-64 3,4-dihydroxylase Tpa1-like proline 4-hydroxylase